MIGLNAWLLLMVAAGLTAELMSSDGLCPNPAVTNPLNMTKIVGKKWYQQSQNMYPVMIMPALACYYDVYTRTAKKGIFHFKMNTYLKNSNKWTGIQTDLAFMNSSKEGKLRLFYDKAPLSADEQSRHWIVDTDHSTYLVVWWCMPLPGGGNSQLLFVETRKMKADPRLITRLTKSLAARGFNTTMLAPVTQDCAGL